MDKDLNSPENREIILASIKPEDAKSHHEILRKIFVLEMDYRGQDGVLEYYENLYHCGLLLFHVGDPSDVEMMWKAKHINMDTGVGFDIETLFGAGFHATLDYLEGANKSDLRSELSSLDEFISEDILKDWADFKRDYYYG